MSPPCLYLIMGESYLNHKIRCKDINYLHNNMPMDGKIELKELKIEYFWIFKFSFIITFLLITK